MGGVPLLEHSSSVAQHGLNCTQLGRPFCRETHALIDSSPLSYSLLHKTLPVFA